MLRIKKVQYLFSVALIHLQNSTLLDFLPLQMDRTVRNCTVKECTVDVKTAITVKARLANNV